MPRFGRPIARQHAVCAANKRRALFQPHEASSKIYQTGCLAAGEAWVERNLLVVAGVAVGVAFLQVGGPYKPHCP